MTKVLQNTDKITMEFGRILHQESNFIGNTNRQYDESYKEKGAKNGASIRIRTPNKFQTAVGATLTEGDVTQQSVTLTVGTQRHVKLPYYTSAELAQNIEDILESDVAPAAKQMIADIEADILGRAYLGVPTQVSDVGNAFTHDDLVDVGVQLTNQLCPNAGRKLILTPTMAGGFRKDTKSLFQSSTNIAEQYREGMLGRTGGFDVYENTLMPRHLSGSSATTTGYTVNGNPSAGATAITVQTGTNTFKAGDVITIADCYDVHAETKTVSNRLKKFVVMADYAGGAGNLSIFPALYGSASGALQNVSTLTITGKAIVKEAGASVAYDIGLAFHKDAFVFATADLPVPSGLEVSSRKNVEGISVRFLQDYDIESDKMISRIDVLYGFQIVRPELATRLGFN